MYTAPGWSPVLPVRPRLTRSIAEIDPLRCAQEARHRVVCALLNVHRVPAMSAHARKMLDRPSMLGSEVPESQYYHCPVGSPTNTLHSCHRANSPLVYFTTTVLLYHRSCCMIAECGTSAPATPPGRMAVNSPGYSHGCKSPLPIAEGVAGKLSCKTSGRKPHFRYSSHG